MYSPIFFYLTCVFISLLVSLVLFELWKCYLNNTILKRYGSILGYPIIGIIPDLLKLDTTNVQAFLDNWCDIVQIKPFFTWFGTYLCFIIDEPEDVKAILNSEHALKKAAFYHNFTLHSGLISMPTDSWKRHRRALNPTLSANMVKSFLPTFNEKCEIMVNELNKHVGSSIDVYRHMFKTSAATTIKSSWGLDWKMHGNDGDKLCIYMTSFMRFVQQRGLRPWLTWDFLYKLTKASKISQQMKDGVFSFGRRAIKEKTEEMQEKYSDESIQENGIDGTGSRLNWIEKSFKLKSENKFSELDIEEELITVLVGSTDTSATTIHGLILMLAIHQNYQQICVDELHDIFHDANEPVTDLSQMSFIELVIKETTRLFPAIPMIGRESTDSIQLRNGTLPKGTTFILSLMKTNRNPKFWGENAHLFYPERFLPENFENIHPYAYASFSHGPRNCIGMRYAMAFLKVVLAYLLRNFKFTTDIKYEDVRYKSSSVLKFINKDVVRVERRQW